MRYPALSRSRCGDLAQQLTEERNPSIDAHTYFAGLGQDVDLQPIEHVAQTITEAMRTWTDSDRDRFEGTHAPDLHQALRPLPFEILDDPGFWRYLALRYFWEFIKWRETESFASGRPERYLRYVDAEASPESVLPRMYLRAAAVGGRDHADLSGGIPNATDFWRSHVLRVRTGSAPTVTRALATMQRDDRLTTDSLRRAARALNRTWTNIVLHIYDDDEAKRVVAAIRTMALDREVGDDGE